MSRGNKKGGEGAKEGGAVLQIVWNIWAKTPKSDVLWSAGGRTYLTSSVQALRYRRLDRVINCSAADGVVLFVLHVSAPFSIYIMGLRYDHHRVFHHE